MAQVKQQYLISHKAPFWGWTQGKGTKLDLDHSRTNFRKSRLQVWLLRLSTSILLWTCAIQLMALGQLWHPHFLKGWPACFDRKDFSGAVNETDNLRDANASMTIRSGITTNKFSPMSAFDPVTWKGPPLRSPRVYRSNGYLLVSCNGGLNQMRAAICDMVAIARLLNLTLVIPELDKTSFWADPSEFKDIFNVEHFLASLRDQVRIVKAVPRKYHERVMRGKILSLRPISWSNESYYLNKILPIFQKHKVVHFSKTDARLANNGLPLEMQKLRCRVNYGALRFTPSLEELGRKIVTSLQAKGSFIALHLRYEMDMLSFSGCSYGCTDAEADVLTRMRYAYPWWREKVIDSVQKRLGGLCPLTPEETALVFKALGVDKDTQIYIAAGEIYGGERRLAPLRAAYPNIVRKETLLNSAELRPFQNHSSQMAALDYLVAIASDVFIPTYDGNMAKVVQGHRRYLGFLKTVLLDRKKLVELIDQYLNGSLQWNDFSAAVRIVHSSRMGSPTRRIVIADRPKEEDYFYANPWECLP